MRVILLAILIVAIGAPTAMAEDAVVLPTIVIHGQPQRPSVSLYFSRTQPRDTAPELRRSFVNDIVRDARTR